MKYIILLLILSSCSYKENYSPSLREELGYISIEGIDSIHGSILYNHLSRLINEKPHKKYFLEIEVDYKESASIVSKEGEVSYKLIEADAFIKLKDLKGKVIFSKNLNVDASYNNMGDPFEAYLQDNKTAEQLYKHLGEKIYISLIKFFSYQDKSCE